MIQIQIGEKTSLILKGILIETVAATRRYAQVVGDKMLKIFPFNFLAGRRIKQRLAIQIRQLFRTTVTEVSL